ncbi:MAG: protein kinase [Acidobacteriales bacterium]|nr:protein kinase [Terriglobales bacterium]
MRAKEAGVVVAEESTAAISLIFHSDPETPARVVLELGSWLRQHPELPVSIGIATRPASSNGKRSGGRRQDASETSLLKRAGKAGQVLIFPNATEVLSKSAAWNRALQRAGEIVADGHRVQVFDIQEEAMGATRPPAIQNGSAESPSSRLAILPGLEIAHYRLGRQLGSGGMGIVFEAEDINLGRMVALKFLLPELLRDPNSVRRFRQEARAASALNHPNICTIHEIGEGPGYLFIAMEKLDGETLRNLIKAEPLPCETLVHLALDIVDALDAAHANGIVHRDLKPSNILVTKRGSAKVLDFGLAKLAPGTASEPEPGDETHAAMRQELTSTGATVGSVNYMSPEQVRGEPLEAASDLFSFGAVLYEMTTGTQCFPGKTWGIALDAVLNRKPATPRSLNPGIPVKLEQIILRLLEKDCRQRYPSAYAARADLLAVRDALGSSGRNRVMPVVRRQSKAVSSIAVLPFEDAVKDEQSEYLSEGITDSIIDILSRLPKLRVMARSTVFRRQLDSMDPVAVGRQLNVNAVLCGRLSQMGERLVIRAELVDTTNGWQLWGEQYSRSLDDIFEIQEEIAREISAKLQLKLSGEEKKRIAKRPTLDTDAYKLYLKGRFYWHKRTEKEIRTAIGYFHEAIRSDPGFALAHSGLADCYQTLSFVFSAMPKEAMASARTAATHALEIDPGLAEGHASKAVITARYDWNLPEAEREFRTAIDLRPGYSGAHQWYGECLAGMERLAEATEEVKFALSLDPLSPLINSVLAAMYCFSRQYDMAEEQAQKTLKLENNFWVARLFSGMALVQMGEFKRALNALQDTANVSQSSSLFFATLGHTYALAGREADARRAFTKLVELSKKQYVPPLHLALVALGLHEDDVALGELEKGVADRNGWLMFLRVDPRFDRLRQHTRFKELLFRSGLMRERGTGSGIVLPKPGLADSH